MREPCAARIWAHGAGELRTGPRSGGFALGIDEADGRDIAGAQAVALTDRLAAEGGNRRLSVAGEGGGTIVHDGTEVVSPDVVTVGNVLVEIVLPAGFDIRPIDADVSVAVLAALFVPESGRVPDFVNGLTESATSA